MEKKVCPKCNKVDTTDFSKCRFCGVSYDWEKPTSGFSINIDTLLKSGIGAALLVVGFTFLRDTVGLNTATSLTANTMAKSTEVIKETTAILKKNPQNVSALIRRAEAEFDAFRPDLAEQDLTAAIKLQPSAELYRRRAAVLQALTREKEAANDRKMAELLAK